MFDPHIYTPPPFASSHYIIPTSEPACHYITPAHRPPLHSSLQDMSSKRVHFAPEPARTPSPAFSSSSMDSPGPVTPLSLPHALPAQVSHSPQHYGTYLTVPQPYDYSKPLPASPRGLQVHPLVNAASHAGASQRPFMWDLRDKPTEITGTPYTSQYEPSYPIPAAALALPATTPPVARLEIRCTTLPWKITVEPSRYYNNVFVTVGDLMSELHTALRRQISREEFDMACKHNPEYRRHIEAAFERRVARSRTHDERLKGIRRVDLLLDSVGFAGFEYVANDNSLLLIVRARS